VLPESLGRLANLLGPDRIINRAYELEQLTRDMGEVPTLLGRRLPPVVPGFGLRPRSTAELAQAVTELARDGVPWTARGMASTGLGGAVPLCDGAVVDLGDLRGVDAVDGAGLRVSVRAGTTFYSLQRALAGSGLELLAQPSNAFGTIGGWAASGGLGLGSLGAGPVSDQVEAIEVVLPTGEVERLQSGDRRFHDFFGTEGQLGVISTLTVRVRRAEPGFRVVGRALPTFREAVSWACDLAGAEPRPGTVMIAGAEETGGDGQLPAGEVVLAELPPGSETPPAGGAGGRELPPETALRLWSRRFFPLDNHLGPVFLASEVVLPAAGAAPFVELCRRLARRYGVPIHPHGHLVRLGDPVEVLLLVVFPCDPRQLWHHLLLAPLAAALTAAGVRSGGRPYGVGSWNTPFVAASLGRDHLDRLARRKRELDPERLVNRGRFFGLATDSPALGLAMRPSVFPHLARAAALTTPRLIRRHDPSQLPASDAERCISCGACVPVCPAVAATGDESVSARSKLRLLRRIACQPAPAGAELADSLRCLKCGQCSEVCARALDLLHCWELLEDEVRARVDAGELGRVIDDFVEQVDRRHDRVLEVTLP
jgi:FAD/FMN-containing dehydrogenase/formate hydrogenlyase subunit 6/NADH:ubiquinone oxidoreductase subunit I